MNSFFKYTLVFLVALFLMWMVQDHLVVKAFAWVMDLIFDSFSLKTSSVIPDVALLVMFIIFGYGLFNLFFVKEFLMIFSLSVFLGVVYFGLYFYSHSETKYLNVVADKNRW